MNKVLTVSINIYDYTNYKQLEATLKSIRQQTEPVDIIISEQFCEIKANNIAYSLAQKYRCKYVLSRTEINSKGLTFNLGKMRNISASVCTTPYIYFTDADIVFLNKYHVQDMIDLISLKSKAALFHPLMYRLKKEDTNNFITSYLNNVKIINEATDCFVCYDATNLKIINDRDVKSYVDSAYYKSWLNNLIEHPMAVNSNTIYKNDYINIHGGGTIVSVEDFWRVGGYGEVYYQWGCEDNDFHWKLSEICQCYELPHVYDKYNILHLEHKLYWNKQMFQLNNKIYQNRKRLGLKDVIKKDLSMPSSYGKAYLKNDVDFINKCILKCDDFSYEPK